MTWMSEAGMTRLNECYYLQWKGSNNTGLYQRCEATAKCTIMCLHKAEGLPVIRRECGIVFEH